MADFSMKSAGLQNSWKYNNWLCESVQASSNTLYDPHFTDEETEA